MKKLIFLIFLILNFNYVFNLESCKYDLVETIPEGIQLNESQFSNTSDTWLQLINQAQSTIDIAEFYFSLKCSDVIHKNISSCEPGENVLQAFIRAIKRGVDIKIVVDISSNTANNEDLRLLENAGAKIYYLNLKQLTGHGILHTKFILVDDKKFYLGSANMDWRSLTQVKEIGIVFLEDCSVIASDLKKIFSIYLYLSKLKQLPSKLPSKFETNYSLKKPLSINLNNVTSKIYLTSSPKTINTPDRTNDIDGILNIIREAKKFIRFSIMDYSPTFLYETPTSYWPIIDDELRQAIISRNVHVKIILGYWRYTCKDILVYLKSLHELRNLKKKNLIEIKLFKVPYTDKEQKFIPYSRVDHCKFLFNERKSLIGTSNWSADYFLFTAGVSFIQEDVQNANSSLRSQLEQVFERDWNSKYTKFLD